MNRDQSSLRRLAGLLLVVLLPAIGASVPILDIMPEDGRVGIESEHHPGTHGLPHNHLICIQQAASQWIQTNGAPESPGAVEVLLPPLPTRKAPALFPHLLLPRSRAPPQA